MSTSTTSRPIDDARSRWLDGDATAWSDYVAHCAGIGGAARPAAPPARPAARARRSTDRLLPYRVDRRPILLGAGAHR